MKRPRFGLVYIFNKNKTITTKPTLFFDHEKPYYIRKWFLTLPCVFIVRRDERLDASSKECPNENHPY